MIGTTDDVGNADVILVHAREQEDRFVAEGHGVMRRGVMYNDFIVIGPKDDPAGIRAVKDPAEALRRIAAGRHEFVSPGGAVQSCCSASYCLRRPCSRT